MTVYAITDTKKGRTGIAPTYLQTTHDFIFLNFYGKRSSAFASIYMLPSIMYRNLFGGNSYLCLLN